jgi:hypothetical protein
VVSPDDVSGLQVFAEAPCEEKQVKIDYHSVAPPISYDPACGAASGFKQKYVPEVKENHVKAPAKVLKWDDDFKRPEWMLDPDHPDWDAQLFYKKKDKVYTCPHKGCL